MRFFPQRKPAGLISVMMTVLATPALANTPPGKAVGDIFTGLFTDLGLLGLGSLAIAAVAAVLVSLRDNGVLSDRWRFGDECDGGDGGD